MASEEITSMNNIANIIKQNTHENDNNIVLVKYNCENCGRCDNNNDNMYTILICKSNICKGSLKCFICSTIEENNCRYCSNKIICGSNNHTNPFPVCHYETCAVCGTAFCKFASNRLFQTKDGQFFDKFSTGGFIKKYKSEDQIHFPRFFCGKECRNYAKNKGYLPSRIKKC